MLSLDLRTPHEAALGLRDRLRKRRLAMDLTQAELAGRSGVALASLRRFERTGLVSLDALLRLSLVLGVLDDFEKVAAGSLAQSGATLDEMLAAERQPKRARGRRR